MLEVASSTKLKRVPRNSVLKINNILMQYFKKSKWMPKKSRKKISPKCSFVSVDVLVCKLYFNEISKNQI